MPQQLRRGSGVSHMRSNNLGVDTMNENEGLLIDARQQLFEFMLEMPEIYGYEQDHLTHAEREALVQNQLPSPEELAK